MDDLYWEIFASEPTDFEYCNVEPDKAACTNSLVLCANHRNVARLCRACKLKLIFLRRQQQIDAGLPRKSRLEQVSSIGQSRSLDADPVLPPHWRKVTVPKPESDSGICTAHEFEGEDWSEDDFRVMTEFLAFEWEEVDSLGDPTAFPEAWNDSDKIRAAYYPDPGSMDDGVFELEFPSGAPTSFCHTVWATTALVYGASHSWKQDPAICLRHLRRQLFTEHCSCHRSLGESTTSSVLFSSCVLAAGEGNWTGRGRTWISETGSVRVVKRLRLLRSWTG